MFTSLIEAMYDDVECAVVIKVQLTERFRVEIGVRQDCLLLYIMFRLFLECALVLATTAFDILRNGIVSSRNISARLKTTLYIMKLLYCQC